MNQEISEWIVSREGEGAIFTYSSMEKDKPLMRFFELEGNRYRFASGYVIVTVAQEHLELFLEEFGLRKYLLERLDIIL